MNNIGTKTIETNRLILRRFTETDAQEIYEGYVNQEDFLYYANVKNKVNLDCIYNYISFKVNQYISLKQ